MTFFQSFFPAERKLIEVSYGSQAIIKNRTKLFTVGKIQNRANKCPVFLFINSII